MGIRDFLFGAPAAKASILPLDAGELANVPLDKAVDDATLLSTFGDDAWPYILANKIGEQASQAPLRLGRPGPDDTFEFVAPADRWQALLDGPNAQQDGGEFVHLLLIYLEMVGHAPIEVATGRSGRPGELYLHNPGPWRIVANRDRSIRGYLYLQDRGDVAWTPEQMTYLRWPNPADPFYGQGRLAAVRQQVMAEEYAAIRDKQFEKRLGVPPGILSSKMPLGDPQARELQRRWEQAVGGYQNAGKIAILGSETSYQAIALNARDAEWLAQRHDRVETMAGAFGVPLPLIRMNDATFSNLEGARAEFWEGTLQPRLNRVARMLTRKLLPLLGVPAGYEVRFDYSAVDALGENAKESADTGKVWAEMGAFTVDEIRKRAGAGPHPDAAVGAMLVVPGTLALKTAEDVLAPPEPPAPAPPPAKARKAERLSRERILEPVAAGYRRDLSGFFTGQLGAILGGLAKAGAPERAKEATKPLPEDVIEEITAIVQAARFRDKLRRISEAPIGTSLTLGAEDAAIQLGISSTFDLAASEEAVARLTTYVERLGVGIQNTTLADVRGILTDALRAGWSNTETRAALSTLFDGYQDWRLDRISRTETTAAYNLGALDQYRDAGVRLVEVVDGDGDDVCASWNGRLVTLEEAQGSPIGHPNCTRTWIPEVPR